MIGITSMEATYATARPGGHDVISDVLRRIRLKSALFYDNRGYLPWVSETPHIREYGHLAMPEAERVIPFKVIMAGTCWAELVDHQAEPIALRQGDILVITNGDRHVLASSPGMRDDEAMDVEEYRPDPDGKLRPSLINEDGGGERSCRFVCGFFGCDAGPFNPLLNALPPLWKAQTATSGTMLQAAIDETADRKAGTETVLARLGELLFVEAVRNHVDALAPESRSWLSGLSDHHVGSAIRLIHAQPAEDWTVDRLARRVGMSRSVFADRFASLVGLSPISYLARWRIQLAASMLQDQPISVGQAAAEVGYDSEAAFRRAFKKLVGVSPVAWRTGHADRGRTPPPT